MKFFFTLSITILTIFNSWSQETRLMTESELRFYTRSIQLLENVFPTNGFNNWSSISKTSANINPRIAITRDRDKGSYEHVHLIEYGLPIEYMQTFMDSLTKEMEGVTDVDRLNEYASTLEHITLSMQLKVTIHINSTHTVTTDRTGKVEYPQLLNQQTNWSSDLLQVAKTYSNKTKNPDCLLIGIGKTSKFKYYKYDSEIGGTVVSETKLPNEIGSNAFKIYNLFIHIEGPHEAGYEFLSKVDWDTLKTAITSNSINK